MEVVVPMKDLHLASTTSTPYVSAPTSPRGFGGGGGGGGGEPFNYYCHYTSAPTSPTRVAALYAASVVPFDWEEASGGARKPQAGSGDNEDYKIDDDDDNEDFAFEFSGQLDVLPPELTAADELFEEGRIRPLKPPPRLYNLDVNGKAPPPRQKSKKGGGGGNPFATAATGRAEGMTRERGRERGGAFPSPSSSIPSSRSRKGSRSLSPMRGELRGSFMQPPVNSPSQASNSAAAPSAKSRGSSKKWRLRDLLLFRSASEGRVTGNRSKDPLRKYTMLSSSNSSSSILPPSSANKRGGGEDSRNSSFRSSDGSVGSSTRRGSMSPHEMHYKSNRAASEEMKKKTPLPFVRQGIFGCLRYNPAVQSIARGFKSSSSFHHRQSQ